MEQTKSFTKFWVRSARDFSLLLSAKINQTNSRMSKLNMVTLTRQTICGNPNLWFQTQNQKRKAQAQNRWKQRLPFFEFAEDLGLTPALSFWLPVAGPLSSPSSSSEPCERRNKQYLDYQNQKSNFQKRRQNRTKNISQQKNNPLKTQITYFWIIVALEIAMESIEILFQTLFLL